MENAGMTSDESANKIKPAVSTKNSVAELFAIERKTREGTNYFTTNKIRGSRAGEVKSEKDRSKKNNNKENNKGCKGC